MESHKASYGDNKDDNLSDNNDSNIGKKQLFILGIDCTKFGPTARYIMLAASLFLFTCGYGYYQEWVVYSWFKRKLGLFTTMFYFIGTAICALVEKYITTGSKPIERKSPWSYHIGMSILKFGAQMLTNVSMGHINYPAKVLFKSAIPIAQIGIGSIWLRRTYPLRDYIVCILLMIGLFVFISGNRKQPDASSYGILLISISVIGAAAVPMVQDHCMATYSSRPTEMLYFSFMGSAILSIIACIMSGEFHTGLSYLYSGNETLLGPLQDSAIHYKRVEWPWLALLMFCTLGYLGAHCSTALTQHFGALTNGITNTARKATSVVISFANFPDEHPLTLQHIVGSIIFFSGLLYRVSSKDKKKCGIINLYSSSNIEDKEDVGAIMTNNYSPKDKEKVRSSKNKSYVANGHNSGDGYGHNKNNHGNGWTSHVDRDDRVRSRERENDTRDVV